MDALEQVAWAVLFVRSVVEVTYSLNVPAVLFREISFIVWAIVLWLGR